MKFRIVGVLAALAAFILILCIGFMQVDSLSENDAEEQMEYIRQAIQRAAVTCYALEGAYPPTLEYLEEGYGVVIDHSRFFVDYSVDGENLAPSIFIFQNFAVEDGLETVE